MCSMALRVLLSLRHMSACLYTSSICSFSSSSVKSSRDLERVSSHTCGQLKTIMEGHSSLSSSPAKEVLPPPGPWLRPCRSASHPLRPGPSRRHCCPRRSASAVEGRSEVAKLVAKGGASRPSLREPKVPCGTGSVCRLRGRPLSLRPTLQTRRWSVADRKTISPWGQKDDALLHHPLSLPS